MRAVIALRRGHDVAACVAHSVQRMTRGTKMDEVARLSTQALWYAWGRIDAGTPDVSGMDSETAFAFRDWYGWLARVYAAGEVGSRPSIMGEWRRFSSAGRVLVQDVA